MTVAIQWLLWTSSRREVCLFMSPFLPHATSLVAVVHTASERKQECRLRNCSVSCVLWPSTDLKELYSELSIEPAASAGVGEREEVRGKGKPRLPRRFGPYLHAKETSLLVLPMLSEARSQAIQFLLFLAEPSVKGTGSVCLFSPALPCFVVVVFFLSKRLNK